MAIGDIIVGIDIGTSRIAAVVGEVNNFNQIEIICSSSYKCTGIKKTKIINEEEVSNSLVKVLDKIEDESGLRVNSAYVTIPGKYTTIVQNSITKEARDKYSGISLRDVQTAIMQVKDIDIPEGKVSIDIVPDKFILDTGKTTEDPVGSLSSSFTLKAQIILADKEYVRQISSIFKKAGIDVDGLVPTTLAQRNLILDNNELHDNVMILDMGAGNTDIGVFEGSSYLYTNTIPLGGNSITNDIALVLNISEEEADKLKKQYGLALKSFIDNDNDILLNTFKGENRNKTIKSSELIEIIEARIEEIERILKNAEVFDEDESTAGTINIGWTVTIKDLEDGEELEYKIVGSTESNSLMGKISNESPVGKALIGHKAGDVISVETQAGVFKYEIIEGKKDK